MKLKYEGRNSCRKQPLVRPNWKWENNSKVNVRQIGREDERRMEMAHKHINWRT